MDIPICMSFLEVMIVILRKGYILCNLISQQQLLLIEVIWHFTKTCGWFPFRLGALSWRFAFATENICCCCRYAFAQIKQLLMLRFRTEQSFQGASDEPLHSRCSLQGLICDANPLGVAQSPLQSTSIQPIYFKKCHPQLLVKSHKM